MSLRPVAFSSSAAYPVALGGPPEHVTASDSGADMSRRLPDFDDYRSAVSAAGGRLYHHGQGDRIHYVFTPPNGAHESGTCSNNQAELLRVAAAFCRTHRIAVTARELPVIDGFEVDQYKRRIIPDNMVLAPADARPFDCWRGGLLDPATVLSYWRHDRNRPCTDGWVQSGDWWFVCGQCHPQGEQR